MHERHRRSIAKGISWRFFATLDTLILAYLFTGSVALAASIGGLEVLTKVLWYYLHERAWLLLSHERLHPRIARHFHPRSPWRSMFKAFTWRFVGVLDTVLISLIITGRLTTSLSIGGTELFTKVVLYFLHERLWLNVRWGVHEKPKEFPHLRAVLEDGLRSLRHILIALIYALLCLLFIVCMAMVVFVLRR
jgi:uncharacterized membrane protein